MAISLVGRMFFVAVSLRGYTSRLSALVRTGIAILLSIWCAYGLWRILLHFKQGHVSGIDPFAGPLSILGLTAYVHDRTNSQACISSKPGSRCCGRRALRSYSDSRNNDFCSHSAHSWFSHSFTFRICSKVSRWPHARTSRFSSCRSSSSAANPRPPPRPTVRHNRNTNSAAQPTHARPTTPPAHIQNLPPRQQLHHFTLTVPEKPPPTTEIHRPRLAAPRRRPLQHLRQTQNPPEASRRRRQHHLVPHLPRPQMRP